jgi:hypothetical protein
LCILMFMFLDSRQEDRRFWTALNFVMNQILISYVVPKYLNFTFLEDLLAIFVSWFFLAFSWRDTNKYVLCVLLYGIYVISQ